MEGKTERKKIGRQADRLIECIFSTVTFAYALFCLFWNTFPFFEIVYFISKYLTSVNLNKSID